MSPSDQYVDGFVLAVSTDKKEAYRKLATDVATVFREHGALAVVECWGDDVPEGKLTSFPMAVKRTEGETVVFAWVAWSSKAARDAGNAKVFVDPRMQADKGGMSIFDGKRMIFGGFETLVATPAVVTASPAAPAPAIQPYLFFRGRCEEAIAYYEKALGAEVLMMLRFKDNPDKPGPDKVPAEMNERIMHASVRIAGSEIMMSDGMKTGPLDFQCMSLSLAVPSEAEADRLFGALAKDGTVQMPMGPTFFAKRFGAVVDKFGVSWMIIVPR